MTLPEFTPGVVADIPDYPNYEEIINFDNPLTETQPSGTRVVEVITETKTFLKDMHLTRARNNDQLTIEMHMP